MWVARGCFVLAMVAVGGLGAQAPGPVKAELPKGYARLDGTDADSGIQYAMISLEGKLDAGASGPVTSQPDPVPRLTAVCTESAPGKQRFEVLADLGGVKEIAFVAPWKAGAGSNFPPPLQHVSVTMEFLGYTKVKPVKRTWEVPDGMPEELRYAPPGGTSSNMEGISYYMQYLKALPLLRLTVPGRGVVEFDTLKWQALVRAEPLCRMSSL